MAQESGRFPRSVYGQGEEPDPRFTLANERTFLAWIRTGLALIAVGVAVEAFAEPGMSLARRAASVLLLAAGVLVPVQAWLAWRRTELAIRLGRPLPGGSGAILLVILIALSAVLVLLSVPGT